MLSGAGRRGWAWIRRDPWWCASLALLSTGPLLALWTLSSYTLGAAWDVVRPATVVERCAAEVRDARQHGPTPLNVDREPYIEMYWTEMQATCVRHRIEDR